MTDSVPHSGPPEDGLIDGAREDVSESLPLADQGADERWTIPWALVEGETPRGEAVLTWCGSDAAVEIGAFSIPNPMLYTADGCPAEPEASCIDTTLEIGVPDVESAPAVGHWSGYAALTPTQRANYIQWLASGASAPLRDIHYAFLYFYGLERHALIDKGDPERVLRALMHLLKHYEGHSSFFSSASRLAAFLFATKGIEKLKPAWFKRLFAPRGVPLHHDSLAVALTWLYERKKPLPAALAFEVARQDIRCPQGSAYRDEPEVFRARFEAAYTARFGEGMTIQSADAKRTWKYRPINPSLQSWEHFAKLWSVTAPDVMGAAEQFAPLVDVWKSCDNPDAPPNPWESLVAEYANADGRMLVPITKVAPVAGVALGKSKELSIAESLAIVAGASGAGYGLIPEPRLLLGPYRRDERVVLIRQAEEPTPDSERYYLAGALLLSLGAAMAEIDGEVDHIEVLHVSEIVNSLYHFNDFDKHRLGVLRKRLLKHPPKLSALTRRLRAILNEEERIEAGVFLVGVAGSNFSIGDEERRALRRAWRAFELPTRSLDALLEALVSTATAEGRDPVNRDALARLMRETKRFAVRLGAAMQEIEVVMGEEAGARDVWYVRKGTVVGEGELEESVQVRDAYRDGLYALLRRGDWSEAEFIALGEREGVFVKGAVLPIDEWAWDCSDDADAVRVALSMEKD
ncbi:MAG: TerB N-terminal domain-containing protein [Candidatus Hydrogenedentes bacterium]|nr:TerB N-terminal domain-containing protein [Candidatus Hydrogenedentota bacterium]